jgi:hypothetical protein
MFATTRYVAHKKEIPACATAAFVSTQTFERQRTAENIKTISY